MHFGDIEVRFLDAACSAWTAMPCSASSPRCSGKRSLPRTNKTRIRMRANSLLVRAHGKNIIVETGNGTKWDSKLRGIYAVQDGDPLIDSLGRSGVAPSEIDLVINTHLHFDHCGGNTRIEGNQPVPVTSRRISSPSQGGSAGTSSPETAKSFPVYPFRASPATTQTFKP
jgi:glyoxylase-like metal-dependent hydrolase (beta-lactamase superfamily II)